MSEATPNNVDHLQTIIGAIICIIVVVPVIALWLAQMFGLPIGSPESSWLPFPVAYVTEVLVPTFFAGVPAGFVALAFTRWLLKRANPDMIAYATVGVYVTLIGIAWVVILAGGGSLTNLVAATAQVAGFAVGLALRS